MMIESLYTGVAIIAMGGPWRPENVASVAKFYLLGMSFYCACVKNWLILPC
jgi:hypothetical protein